VLHQERDSSVQLPPWQQGTISLNCHGMHQGSLERHIRSWDLYYPHVLAAAVIIRLLECGPVIGMSRQCKHSEVAVPSRDTDAWHNYNAVLGMCKNYPL